jgi:type IV secretory pathway TrbD component
MSRRTLQKHKVYQSLIQTPLYAGVDRGFLILEVALVGFLFFAIGVHLVTLLVAVLWTAVIHPVMVWVSRKDPLLPVLYVRSLARKDYYPPHARPQGTFPGVKASIPTRR